MEREKIASMPKIDLHCHLDGSLALHSMEELLGRQVSQMEVQVAKDCRNLAEYLEKFDLPLSCLQTAEGLRRASRDFLLEAAKENMVYVEARFAPLLSVQGGLNCEQVIEAVLTGLKEAREQCGTQFGVIACAMRHQTEEENLSMFRAARLFLGEGLGAVDLAGNEAAYPMKQFKTLFAEAVRLGLPFTLHAGECGSVENVLESVNCGAARIGHGIALKGHPAAIQLCKEKNVTLELCPTSNLQTKAVPDESQYPLREFLDAGLRVTINTDNRTVSGTTMTEELEFVQKAYGISDDELMRMTRYAAEAAFTAETEKDALLRRLDLWEAAE